MLMDELKAYANPKTKLSRLVKENVYFPIVRGLYETSPHTAGYLLAGSIYGPSYLSFEFALSFYGLIPERVTTFTSATCLKKKKNFLMRLKELIKTMIFPSLSILVLMKKEQ